MTHLAKAKTIPGLLNRETRLIVVLDQPIKLELVQHNKDPRFFHVPKWLLPFLFGYKPQPNHDVVVCFYEKYVEFLGESWSPFTMRFQVALDGSILGSQQ